MLERRKYRFSKNLFYLCVTQTTHRRVHAIQMSFQHWLGWYYILRRSFYLQTFFGSPVLISLCELLLPHMSQLSGTNESVRSHYVVSVFRDYICCFRWGSNLWHLNQESGKAIKCELLSSERKDRFSWSIGDKGIIKLKSRFLPLSGDQNHNNISMCYHVIRFSLAVYG